MYTILEEWQEKKVVQDFLANMTSNIAAITTFPSITATTYIHQFVSMHTSGSYCSVSVYPIRQLLYIYPTAIVFLSIQQLLYSHYYHQQRLQLHHLMIKKYKKKIVGGRGSAPDLLIGW